MAISDYNLYGHISAEEREAVATMATQTGNTHAYITLILEEITVKEYCKIIKVIHAVLDKKRDEYLKFRQKIDRLISGE